MVTVSSYISNAYQYSSGVAERLQHTPHLLPTHEFRFGDGALLLCQVVSKVLQRLHQMQRCITVTKCASSFVLKLHRRQVFKYGRIPINSLFSESFAKYHQTHRWYGVCHGVHPQLLQCKLAFFGRRCSLHLVHASRFVKINISMVSFGGMVHCSSCRALFYEFTSRSRSWYSGLWGGGGCSSSNSRSFTCCRSTYSLPNPRQHFATARCADLSWLISQHTSPSAALCTSRLLLRQ